jgi:hypothetical protein
MRKTWNVSYLLGRIARWAFTLGIVLPLGIAIGVVLAALWLLWLAVEWVHSQLLRLQIPVHERRSAATRIYGPGIVRRGPGDLRMIELTQPVHRPPLDDARPRRHTLDDVRRSLAGMARYGWSKEKVIDTLEAAGAAWVWSERWTCAENRSLRTAPSPEAREHVQLRYRPGDTLFQRYSMPPARIDIWFDRAGRIVAGDAHQDRRI